MAPLLRRLGTPVLAGLAVWLLSFPLTTGAAHGRLDQPVLAAALDFAPRSDDRPSPAIHRAPRTLVLGQLAPTPPPPTAPAVALAAPAQAAFVTAPAAPRIGANWLLIPRLGLSQPVGWYGDCSGSAPVPRWGAWRESCAGANNTYIMAHNPGVFTPILGLHAGDVVLYGDPSGRVHTFRVTFTTIVSDTQLWPLGALSTPSLTLQTCWTWDGTRDFIVRAIQI
jgi:hypothetical protein